MVRFLIPYRVSYAIITTTTPLPPLVRGIKGEGEGVAQSRQLPAKKTANRPACANGRQVAHHLSPLRDDATEFSTQ
jgi:hypothetical protein